MTSASLWLSLSADIHEHQDQEKQIDVQQWTMKFQRLKLPVMVPASYKAVAADIHMQVAC